ncbi:AraC family transcriptional regulator [Paenibacillus oenotherae]|uniref:AraC family transcriptional regulator n=1 Tax=Paenibacillus oenotherae TaxID=1435645 RepID=A0ABS7DA61_9BACL|nr:helix-turn-helix domain-containing protein [Paenibacillus oenotherae]MBW7476827.1 AraC family transcriptional regulator [Paenibacillus oenotherae]
MKPTYKTIIQNYFQRFQAEVAMAAFSVKKPGFTEEETPDYYRLWFIHEGEGWLHFNGRRYEGKPGHLFLLPPGANQSYGSMEEQSLSLYWCHFRSAIGDTQLFELLQLPVRVEPPESDYVESLFVAMIDALRSDVFTRKLRVRAALLNIMASYLELCDLSDEAFSGIESLDKIDRVLEYIDLHLSENIGVNELARLAYLHPNYFISVFKNVVGCSPIQYVNLRRLELAKQLLESTDENVSGVAKRVGLQNHYLSRLFKQHTGLSPSRYRQIYRAVPARAQLEIEGSELHS